MAAITLWASQGQSGTPPPLPQAVLGPRCPPRLLLLLLLLLWRVEWVCEGGVGVGRTVEEAVGCGKTSSPLDARRIHCTSTHTKKQNQKANAHLSQLRFIDVFWPAFSHSV